MMMRPRWKESARIAWGDFLTQEAVEFLAKTSVPGIYDFEPVLCPAGRDVAHTARTAA